MDQWYCRLGGKEDSGPFRLDELRFLLDRGKLAPVDQVRQGPQGKWRAAVDVSELFPPVSPAREGLPPGDGSEEASTDRTAEPAVEAAAVEQHPTRPARPSLPARTSPDATRDKCWKHAAVGGAIGVGVVLFLLLLLALLSLGRPGGAGFAGMGAGGQGADSTGVGTGTAETGEASAAGEGEAAPAPAAGGRGATEPQGGAAPAAAPVPVGREEDSGDRQTEPPPEPARFAIGRPNLASDFEQRLQREGARSGDVQVSLLWDNLTDLDLHVVTPANERIYYNHRRSSCGGELDVDMNVDPSEASTEPVENIYWGNRAPSGTYQVFVHHYRTHGGPSTCEYRVSVKAGGETQLRSGTVVHGAPPKLVYEFRR